jgi:hypothetical protein
MPAPAALCLTFSRPWGCPRQFHGGSGVHWAECHRAKWLLRGTGPVAGAGGKEAQSIPECERETNARDEKAEGTRTAQYLGAEGDQGAQPVA